jgi:hypothetical protein
MKMSRPSIKEELHDTLEYSARARKPSTSLVSPVVIINRFAAPPETGGREAVALAAVCSGGSRFCNKSRRH